MGKVATRFLPFWFGIPIAFYLEYATNTPTDRVMKIPHGWTPCAEPCPSGGPTWFEKVQITSTSSLCPSNQCIGGQALPFAAPYGAPVATNQKQFWVFQRRIPPFLSTRYDGIQAWTRPVTTTHVPTYSAPFYYPVAPPLEWFAPSWDPYTIPPKVPLPTPSPIPWKSIPFRPLNRPDRAPGEQTQVGPASQPIGDPKFNPNAEPGTEPLPAPVPKPGSPRVVPDPFDAPRFLPTRRRRFEPRPDTIPRYDPQGEPVPQSRPIPRSGLELAPKPGTRRRPGHDFAKPPPGTKERKFIGNISPRSPLGLLVNFITESVDTINAIYKALPADIRSATFRKGGYVRVSPQVKAQTIYDNFDAVDINQAIENIVLEQLEDFVYGKLGQASASASKNLGLTGATPQRTLGNIRRTGIGPTPVPAF